MASTDPLFGIRSKIERAKKHVADLDVAVRAFHDSRPYGIGFKHDANTRRLIYEVTRVDPVPCDIPQITGDAIGNLISILDHLAYRLFLTGDRGGTGRNIYFPIGNTARTAAEYMAERQRKVKGIPPHIVVAMDTLEPYYGGKGHQLWVLNELNNLSKHRDLIAVGGSFRGFNVGQIMAELMDATTATMPDGHPLKHPMPVLDCFLAPSDRLCPLKVGDELYIDAPEAKPKPNLQFGFTIALNEPQIIQAEPLIETVHQLAGLVDNIVAQFTPFL